jgi:hypothetical protein
MSLKLRPLATDWGKELHMAALARGINSRLETTSSTPSPGATIFTRPLQRAPEAGRSWALRHMAEGVKSVQSEADLRCYENRAVQMETLADWFPEGVRVLSMEQAAEAIEYLGLPIVSKANFGSASKTVRILRDKAEAMAEAQRILHGQGESFPGLPTQYGECLWQRFLPANSYSLRVARITEDYGWAFKVMNRTHDWRASGSGICVPLKPEEWNNPYFLCAINTALQAAHAMRSRWVGFDLLQDRERETWRIVDVTLAWNNRANLVGGNYDAPVYDLHTCEPHPKGLRGAHQWGILLDDLVRKS